jgi:hypothetical protein
MSSLKKLPNRDEAFRDVPLGLAVESLQIVAHDNSRSSPAAKWVQLDNLNEIEITDQKGPAKLKDQE